MATPAERLQTIIDNFTPSQVVFKGGVGHDGSIALTPVRTCNAMRKHNDDPLQEATELLVTEYWSHLDKSYVTSSTAADLYGEIKRHIINAYRSTTARSPATVRKTEVFIHGIRLDNTHLANFLLATFILIRSPEWGKMSMQEQRAKFEDFESLRRVYGKR